MYTKYIHIMHEKEGWVLGVLSHTQLTWEKFCRLLTFPFFFFFTLSIHPSHYLLLQTSFPLLSFFLPTIHLTLLTTWKIVLKSLPSFFFLFTSSCLHAHAEYIYFTRYVRMYIIWNWILSCNKYSILLFFPL